MNNMQTWRELQELARDRKTKCELAKELFGEYKAEDPKKI